MSNKVLETYVQLLETAQLKADDHGIIHKNLLVIDDNSPFIVEKDGKRFSMVMPIKEQSSNPDWSNRVVFHPLVEEISRGESVVMEAFRKHMVDRLNLAYRACANMIAALASDPSSHADLSSGAKALIQTLGDADQKFMEMFSKVNSKEPMISIYIKRNGEANGKNWLRAAIVTSPFAEAFYKVDEKERVFLGEKLRVKDMGLMENMLKILFPFAKKADFSEYCTGRNSLRAPTLTAFMDAVKIQAEVINLLVNGLGHDQLIKDCGFRPLAWVDALADLDSWKREILLIPALPGNEGRSALVNPNEESATPPWEAATSDDLPADEDSKRSDDDRSRQTSSRRNDYDDRRDDWRDDRSRRSDRDDDSRRQSSSGAVNPLAAARENDYESSRDRRRGRYDRRDREFDRRERYNDYDDYDDRYDRRDRRRRYR